MSRLQLAALGAAIVCTAACARSPGTPEVHPLPQPDGKPSLLGAQAARSPRLASYKLAAKLDPVTHRVFFPLMAGPGGTPVLRIMRPRD